LAENKKKEGVKVTKSGLQYKVLVEGTGALPTDSSQIQVNYEGKLIDGTVFDSSYERNMPYTVDMSRPHVIEGWIEALKMMPAGSKWEVTIPQELGYGSQNQGPIKPFSTLIFTIEVLK
jgi:FKBP-type peptidyl-prolyl cis-trans isomerase FklB